MGTIKDKNGRDLTEAEDIKKRRQEYIKKVLFVCLFVCFPLSLKVQGDLLNRKY